MWYAVLIIGDGEGMRANISVGYDDGMVLMVCVCGICRMGSYVELHQ